MEEKTVRRALRAMEDELAHMRQNVHGASPAHQRELAEALDRLATSSSTLEKQISNLDDAHATNTGALHDQLRALRKEFAHLKLATTHFMESEVVGASLNAFSRRLDHFEVVVRTTLRSAVRKEMRSFSGKPVKAPEGLGERLEHLKTFHEGLARLQESYSDNASSIEDLNHKLTAVLSALSDQRARTEEGMDRERALESLSSSVESNVKGLSKAVERHSQALRSMDLSLSLLRSSLESSTERMIAEKQHVPWKEDVQGLQQEFSTLKESLEQQRLLLAQIKEAMPYSNQFEEVIQHADLVEQHTLERMDALQNAMAVQGQRSSHFNTQLAQLTPVLRDLNEALGGVSLELRRRQMEASKRDAHLAGVLHEVQQAVSRKKEDPELQKLLSNLQFQMGQVLARTHVSKRSDDDLSMLRREISDWSKRVQPSSRSQVDLTPLMDKIDELRLEFWFQPREGSRNAKEATVLQKPLVHQQVLLEIQDELEHFKEMDLSPRARLSVDRMNELAERGLSLQVKRP
ncbi:hypothetical protein KJ765_06560 [Candidatus Micrarchaeota archaeon]|nr:hypothetical protein [Candidatus Micrarchaeota archaeon]